MKRFIRRLTEEERKETKKRFKQTYQIDIPSKNQVCELKISVKSFGIAACLFPINSAIVILIIYIIQGRWSNYFPTISETGTNYPNVKIFAHCMSIGAITTMISMYIYTCYLQVFVGLSKTYFNILLFLCFIEVIGSIGLGLSPINEVPNRHFLTAGTGFLSIQIFELLSLIKSAQINSLREIIIRSIILFLAVFGLCIFAFSESIWIDRVSVSYSTIGEYTMLIFMMSPLIQWGQELNSVGIYIVDIDNLTKELTSNS